LVWRCDLARDPNSKITKETIFQYFSFRHFLERFEGQTCHVLQCLARIQIEKRAVKKQRLMPKASQIQFVFASKSLNTVACRLFAKNAEHVQQHS